MERVVRVNDALNVRAEKAGGERTQRVNMANSAGASRTEQGRGAVW